MVGGSIYPVCFCGQFTGILRIGCRLAVLRFVRIRAHVNHAMRRGFNEVVVNSIAFVMKSHSVSEFFNVFLPNLFGYVDIGCRHIPECGTFKVDVFWILVFFIGILVVKNKDEKFCGFQKVMQGAVIGIPFLID